MPSTPPTCTRCGAELPRATFVSPIDGRELPERWCSDACYQAELAEKSKESCRAQRMRMAARRDVAGEEGK